MFERIPPLAVFLRAVSIHHMYRSPGQTTPSVRCLSRMSLRVSRSRRPVPHLLFRLLAMTWLFPGARRIHSLALHVHDQLGPHAILDALIFKTDTTNGAGPLHLFTI